MNKLQVIFFTCIRLSTCLYFLGAISTICGMSKSVPGIIATESSSLEAPIVKALLARDLPLFSRLLSGSAAVNTVDGEGKSLLYKSVELGFVEFFDVLISKDASLELASNEGMTPLHEAVRQSSSYFLLSLLKKKANVSAVDRNMRTALHWAASKGFVDGLEELLEAGAPMDVQDRLGRTALHVAVIDDSIECMESLLRAKAQIDSKDADGKTALHWAATLGRDDFVEDLIGAGAAIEIVDNNRSTALAYAEKKGHKRCCEFIANRSKLIDKKTWINARYNNGSTRLHHILTQDDSCYRDERDCDKLKQLIEKGARLNVRDESGFTPLILAASWGMDAYFIEMTRILLQAGARKETRSRGGNTALHYAAIKGDKDRVKLLLDAGAKKDLQNHSGGTALHQAAFRGNVECLELLIEEKVALDLQDYEGKTALHVAANKGWVDCVELLCVAGAKKTIRDKDGQTPLDMALSEGHSDCANFLQEGKTNYSAPSLLRRTLLHSMVCEDEDGTIGLLSRNVNVNAQDRYGRTPLHLAAQNGDSWSVTLLLDKGAKVEIKDVEGRVPLHLAALGSDPICITLLLQAGASKQSKDVAGLTPLALALGKKDKETLRALLGEAVFFDDIHILGFAIADGDINLLEALVLTGAGVDIFTSRKNDRRVTRSFNGERAIDDAITIAAEMGRAEAISLLLKYGAKIGKKTLLAAVERGHVDAVRALLKGGALLELPNTDWKSLLHNALRKLHGPVVKLLVESGAQIHSSDEAGSTPLHVAAEVGLPGSIDILMNHGAIADIDRLNKAGNTPLHLALNQGHAYCAEKLLNYGARKDFKDGRGRTLFECAFSGGLLYLAFSFAETIDMIYAAEGVTLLHGATSIGDENLVKFLISKKASLEVRTGEGGHTPLHVAAMTGQLNCLRALLASGASTEAKDSEGMTPREVAIKEGHQDCVKEFDRHSSQSKK